MNNLRNLIHSIVGALVFIGYTSGVLAFWFFTTTGIAQSTGRNIPEGSIISYLIFLAFILIALIWGNILLYKYFRNSSRPGIAYGMPLGFLISVIGFIIYQKIEQIQSDKRAYEQYLKSRQFEESEFNEKDFD